MPEHQSHSLTFYKKDAVLMGKASDVPRGRNVKELVAAMRYLMRKHNGIGIAAPQAGSASRLFLVDKESFSFSKEDQDKITSDTFINPKIIRKSFKKDRGEEGCLSVPGVFGIVKRSSVIVVEAEDIARKKFRLSAQGLLARVLQHELDHLDGVLFIERADPKTLHELLPKGGSRLWKK